MVFKALATDAEGLCTSCSLRLQLSHLSRAGPARAGFRSGSFCFSHEADNKGLSLVDCILSNLLYFTSWNLTVEEKQLIELQLRTIWSFYEKDILNCSRGTVKEVAVIYVPLGEVHNWPYETRTA